MLRSYKKTESSAIDSLDNLTDEELAVMCKETRSAVSVLISRYIKLIWKKAYYYSRNYFDTEDLSQEGLLALLKAANTFDKSNGAKFSSYCDACITNRIKNAALKRDIPTDSNVSADDIDEEDNVTPELICLEKESAKEIYSQISSLLTDKEWKIFSLFLNDMSYSEISKQLNISTKSVDNAIFRVRKKLRTYLSPNHYIR